jgi:hypothetical protein
MQLSQDRGSINLVVDSIASHRAPSVSHRAPPSVGGDSLTALSASLQVLGATLPRPSPRPFSLPPRPSAPLSVHPRPLLFLHVPECPSKCWEQLSLSSLRVPPSAGTTLPPRPSAPLQVLAKLSLRSLHVPPRAGKNSPYAPSDPLQVLGTTLFKPSPQHLLFAGRHRH